MKINNINFLYSLYLIKYILLYNDDILKILYKKYYF